MKVLNQNTTNILIATFSPWHGGKRLPINGNLEPMLDFFVPKTKKTVLIDQVYPGSDSVMPRIEVYEKNKPMKILSSSKWLYILYPFLRLVNSSGTHISFKLRDFFSVIDWCLRDRKTSYDFFIGLEAINVLAGIVMRKFGLIKRVIYYVSDYSPNRYRQKWFNTLYLWMDRFCAMYADYIWDVSKAMQPARIKAGLNPRKSAPVINVPNALYPRQIIPLSVNKIQPYSLVFLGTLGKENGPDLAIEAFSLVSKKWSQARLHIIGGPNKDIIRLKGLAEKLAVKKKIRFYGFISDREKSSKMIRQFSIGLAPYRAIPESVRLYGDATKIRTYLATGLPVVTTEVSPLGKEARDKDAALVVKDSVQSIARAIIKLFTNNRLYLKLRRGAIQFAKDNTWEKEFTEAFEKMARYES